MGPSVKAVPIKLEELRATGPFQSLFWAEAKRFNGWEPLAFRVDASGWSSDCLCLLRRFRFGLSLCYVPMGLSPECSAQEALAFADAVRPHLPRKCLLMRVDLPWGASPEISGKRLLKCRSSVQPTGTVRIDLTSDLDFKERVRRNLRKEDAVIVTRWGGDPAEFGLWYQTYVHTALRDHFSARPEAYIRNLLSIEGKGAEPILYIARSDGEVTGGILNLRCGKEELYLFGSSVKHTRNVSCGYSLQAHAILEAKAAGVEVYDLFGIEGEGEENSHIASLTTFKTAFGGERVYRPGTFDIPYRPCLARLFRWADSARFLLARRSRI